MSVCIHHWLLWSEHYGSFNKNQPPGVAYMLNIWSLVGRTIWGELGGMALEEVCHWSWGFQRPAPFPVCRLCFLFVDWDVNSQLLLQQHACLPPCITSVALHYCVLVMYDQKPQRTVHWLPLYSSMQLSIAHFVVGFEAVPHSLVQVGFKLKAIHLPQPFKC